MLWLDKLSSGSPGGLTRNQIIAYAILAMLCVIGATRFVSAPGSVQQSTQRPQVQRDYRSGAYGQ